jgi:hypothetical protein
MLKLKMKINALAAGYVFRCAQMYALRLKNEEINEGE